MRGMIGFCAAFAMTATVAFAQPAGEMPEYEGEVNGVSDGAVTPLERQNSGYQFKAPVMGLGSPKP